MNALIAIILVIWVLCSIYKDIKANRKECKEFEKQLIIDMEKEDEPKYLMAVRMNTPHIYKILHEWKKSKEYKRLATRYLSTS